MSNTDRPGDRHADEVCQWCHGAGYLRSVTFGGLGGSIPCNHCGEMGRV